MTVYWIAYGQIENNEDGTRWLNTDEWPVLSVHLTEGEAARVIRELVVKINNRNRRRADQGYTRVEEEDFIIIPAKVGRPPTGKTLKRIMEGAWGGWLGPRGFDQEVIA